MSCNALLIDFLNFTQINRFYPLVWLAMTAINHAMFFSFRKIDFSLFSKEIQNGSFNNNLMKLFQQYQQ